jgi:hypothetical protein
MVTVTVAAALVEFFLLRTLLRMGAFAPPGETIDAIFNLLLTGGLVGFNVAIITSAVAIAIIAALLWRGLLGRVLATLLITLLAVAALLSAFAAPVVLILYQGLAVAAIVTLAVLHPNRRSWDFAGSVAVLAAIVSTLYYQADLNASALGAGLPYASSVFSGGEVAAIAAPLLLLPGRRWRRWAVPVALLAAVAFLMMSSRPFVPLVAAWTVYLTLLLPSPVYAVALGALVYVLWDLLSDPTRRWMGYGLLLVALAGRMFQNTYLAHLSLLGAILMVLPATVILAETAEAVRTAGAVPREKTKAGEPVVSVQRGD